MSLKEYARPPSSIKRMCNSLAFCSSVYLLDALSKAKGISEVEPLPH